ncbi:ferric iron reductase [Chlorogloeopsis sp. ULAP01]|uniref:ferric iron reductase n=1 Tax=Chlorogloeopsis sp. ULAP01 TaxID=3056483 RepID=UPI0025AB4121|nr:ferric iron reductase [Chlorogloeopsis sp. ULAP01]MDM9382402.1 ferric iron reductase [Chlorogloeopsis sp. ULAP01]
MKNSKTVIYPQQCPIPIPDNYPAKLVNNVNDLHQAVFTGLFQNHFLAIINRLHSLTKVSQKTLWGNAVNTAYGIFEELDGYANQ